MVNPKPFQSTLLEGLKELVLDLMIDMEIWSQTNTKELSEIKLGVLRSDATQKHGVTRWKRGVDTTNLQPNDVEVIDIHPDLLEDKWKAYGAFVLHHEYIHALGFRGHDAKFRYLEHSWPGSKAAIHGSEFTEFLRMKNAKWIWHCVKCGNNYPRKKPSKGRYNCRQCSKRLIDKKV